MVGPLIISDTSVNRVPPKFDKLIIEAKPIDQVFDNKNEGGKLNHKKLIYKLITLIKKLC